MLLFAILFLHALESKLYIIDLVHISDFIIKLYPYLLLSYSPYDGQRYPISQK
jgi:hypothetical protein